MKAQFLYSSAYRKEVSARIAAERPGLIVLNGADLVWILDYLPASIPRILVAHNIEHQLFEAQIRNLGPAYRPLAGLLRRDCARLKEYELQGMRDCSNVIFLSHEEAAYAERLGTGLRTITMPPVFDYEPRPRQPAAAGQVLEIGLLGNFRWWPNQLALRWFADEVLPHVTTPVRIHVFGQSGGPAHPIDPRIVEHGVVESLDEVWERCGFLICPVFATGGVCVKLAEALYNRMPVLATSHAARGLALDADPALVLLDHPSEWISFLNSPAARELSAQQISARTASRFSIHNNAAALQRFVNEVMARTVL